MGADDLTDADVTPDVRRVRVRQVKAALAVVAVMAVLAGVRLAPAVDNVARRRSTGRPATSTTTIASATPEEEAERRVSATPPDTSPATDAASSSPETPLRPSSERFACRRGANGGATGEGVTATEIKLLVSAHLDGPAKTLAEDAPKAIKAVFDDAGGICGRRLTVRVVNQPFSRPFDPSAFLAVVPAPLDRHFDARLADGSFDRWRILALGADGLSRIHFDSPWSRPMAPPIESLTRIAVNEAYRAGARSFALVHDARTFPGARPAFDDYVRRLAGATVKATEELDQEKPSYSGEANRFNSACGDACDAVVLALTPDTARKWFQAGARSARVRTANLALFHDAAQDGCGALLGGACTDIWTWTGFTPAIDEFRNDPDVRAYSEKFPKHNQFTMNAYVTAHVLVQALRDVGPELTRERLRQAIDTMTYRSGLVSELDWSPTVRVGNASARAVYVDPRSGSWRDAGTGWVRDPLPGHFPG